jgi:hypothetical protein
MRSSGCGVTEGNNAYSMPTAGTSGRRLSRARWRPFPLLPSLTAPQVDAAILTTGLRPGTYFVVFDP